MQSSPTALVRGPIDGQRLLATVANAAAGANVLFLGTTRGITDGVETHALEYEAHEPMAAAALERLQDEAMERFGLLGCRTREVAVLSRQIILVLLCEVSGQTIRGLLVQSYHEFAPLAVHLLDQIV